MRSCFECKNRMQIRPEAEEAEEAKDVVVADGTEWFIESVAQSERVRNVLWIQSLSIFRQQTIRNHKFRPFHDTAV